MKRSILMSVKPKLVAKILNGEKTIEIQKTAPNCWLPIDVYICCMKRGVAIEKDCGLGFPEPINGKVVAKFTLLMIERFGMAYPYEVSTSRFLKKACVTVGEARRYANGKHPYYNQLYAWHIDNLEIFDKPKELDEFYLKKAPQSWCYVEKEE